ncbi:Dual specificity phosphatase, catalytic domain containing protein [Novymonas esmeraldas]|uniref:Dual specificity phosphatase, catalytic domain containing protein n=1 Tax=Novymonas esmeraldas TaxID=1808958 RepID=A0AAW0ERF3_9TRYP
MGNRVSTSTSPISLEALEALARAPSVLDSFTGDGASAGNVGGGHVPLRREAVGAEMERQHAEYDTSLHALRCVLDRTGTRHSRSLSNPATSRGASHASRTRGRSLDPVESRSPSSRSATRVGGGAAREAAATVERQCGDRRLARDRVAEETPLSPRSWLFREVSVQPVRLSVPADVVPTEVYVLIVVQRAAAQATASTPATSTITSATAHTRSASPPLASASATAPRHAAATASEWPRDMTHVFTPRGLSTPFSTDMTRPTLGGGGGSGAWRSPLATPRTSGSASGRPTPRGAPAAVGIGHASVASAPSPATPRNTAYHHSIHLLTGKRADAMTAAAGLLLARAVERLLHECADLDRRLFFNFDAAAMDAVVRAYSIYAATDTTTTTTTASSSTAAAAAAASHRGNRGSRGSSKATPVDSSSGGGPPRTLPHLTAALEASRELRRELLAITRPVPVAVPRFSRRGCGGGGADHLASGAVSANPAELYSLNAVLRVLNGIRVGTPRWMRTGDAVSPLASARFGVLGGAAASTTSAASAAGAGSWHQDPLPSLRVTRRTANIDGVAGAVPGSNNTTTAAAGVTAPVLSLAISSWLQGPQPLEVSRAAPAAGAALPSATKATTTTTTSATATTTPRMGRPPRRAWAPPSATATPPSLPLPLPTLALDAVLGSRRPATAAAAAAAAAAGTVVSAAVPSETVAAATAGGAVSLPPHSRHDTGPTADAPSCVSQSGVAGSTHDVDVDAAPAPVAVGLLRLPGGAAPPPLPLPEEAVQLNGKDDAEDAECNEVHTQQERARRLKAAQPEVTEVLPYLFVGGEDAARDRAQLLRKGITHIVNTVSWCLDNFFPNTFRYLTLSLSDAADEPVFPLFAVVNAFIAEAQERHHGRVFIHCQQGVSRSCTFVIAHVMWKMGLCYDRAYELVRARRNVCSPNLGFFMNLRLWEAQLSCPLLNCLYAYAPYTATSPMPFSYRLTAYFDCAASATVGSDAAAGAAPSSSSAGLSPRDKAAHQQLRKDILASAVDRSTNLASSDALALDARLVSLFLFAPSTAAVAAGDGTGRSSSGGSSNTQDTRRSTQQAQPHPHPHPHPHPQQRPRLSRPGDATTATAATDGDADGGAVTACIVAGPQGLGRVYRERALAAARQLLRFAFYHGEERTSTTNAGKVIHFCPLRLVRLLPATGPVSMGTGAAATASLLSSSAVAAPVPLEAAQRLLSAHVATPVRLRFTRDPQWDALFANPRLGAMFSCHAAEEDRLESSEAARRGARELASPAAKGAAAAVAHSTDAVDGGVRLPSVPVTGLAATPAALPPRAARHTSRTPRQLHTPTTGSDAGKRSGRQRAAAAGEEAEVVAESAPQTRQPPPVPLPRTPSLAAPALQLSGFAGLALGTTAAAAQGAGASGSSSGSSSGSNSLRRSDGACVAAPCVPAQLSEGESFAFAYPFTSATQESIADLDDLAEECSYLLGFRERAGISVYLWRGAAAAESAADVVDAFVRRLLSGGDATAVAASLLAGTWTSCSMRCCPDDDDDSRGDGGARAATGVLTGVRVLCVEQGEEPAELLTLL